MNFRGMGSVRQLVAQRGFTIIELMMVLVIMAIMVTLAAPSLQNQIRDNRVETAANSLMAAFNMTRAEAIRRGQSMKICAVANPNVATPVCSTDWSSGWMIFLDANDDGDAADAGDLVYRVGAAMNSVTVTATPDLVTFSSRGQPIVGADSYQFDPSTCSAGTNKRVTVSLGTVGRSKAITGKCT